MHERSKPISIFGGPAKRAVGCYRAGRGTQGTVAPRYGSAPVKGLACAALEGQRRKFAARRVQRAQSSASCATTGRPSTMRTQPASTASPHRPVVKLTHPDKMLYPQQGLTKRKLLDYALLVADRMLPHVVQRPLTLVRCPNGEGRPCFFQKHPQDAKIAGLRSVEVPQADGTAEYSVIDDEQGLFALVQLGALEIHIGGSFAQDFEHPNLLVFDLDPDVNVEFRAVIECAQRLREVFRSIQLESFVKTTGGKGLHVCVPIAPHADWDHAKAFTKSVADALVLEAPERYVAKASKAQRKGKVFIDYLRNARGATFVAPYSTRARPFAPVATPIFWEELTPRFNPEAFTVASLAGRLGELREDPFARLLTLHQALPSSGHFAPIGNIETPK